MSSIENVSAQAENLPYACEFCAAPVGKNAIGLSHKGYHTEYCSWHCVSGRALRAMQAYEFVQSELVTGLEEQVRELETTIAHLRAGADA